MQLELDTTERKAEVFRVLSLCYHAPDDELLEVLRAAPASVMGTGTLPPLIELQRDYAQLFVGPFEVPAPPYGSVYLEANQRVCGESTLDVIARYREDGLQLKFAQPADHVALELEYLYVLAFRQLQATTAGDAVSACRYLEKQNDFVRTHLGAWMPMLREKIVENAQTDFYPNVAETAEMILCC